MAGSSLLESLDDEPQDGAAEADRHKAYFSFRADNAGRHTNLHLPGKGRRFSFTMGMDPNLSYRRDHLRESLSTKNNEVDMDRPRP